ncbi:carbohydrate ABC transporter permease [Methylovirgula sp. 4M-Z18]|uniref:carbohydrate ABC transporter permease n=1 Tax=Methylovirgula sp. 4M-Z18 TaxID=2293567 RepID=UPI000E2F0CA4|nr:carbohydrate ABC transporter permease [Methylovirgula sp. 4M-Z18]RFB78823.1 carbohydrate ABC transporter permease [Methylovirgula sp. 4M-Z18]
MKADGRFLGLLLAGAGALLWAIPFLWMLIAAFRPGVPIDIASLTPTGPFSFENFTDAWASGPFITWYLNTLIMCGGILVVQIITVSAAGYAFARLEFRGKELLFAAFLAQLLLIPSLLLVPNLTTLSKLGLYDTMPGVMAPYFASAFGVFLMRQTFRTIPRDYEEAAMMDGAGLFTVIFRILLPLAQPAMTAFAIVSVTSHWNEFLWPLVVLTSPRQQVLTVGLASFASGTEAGSSWGTLAAGTLLVAGPLLLLFLIFQRRFVASFVFSGIK